MTHIRKFYLRTVTCAASACALGGVLFATSTPVRAEDDNLTIDRRIYRGILEGIGLRRDGEAPINYEERPPLVIPPARELPPPERTDAALSQNPAWPKDPDIARRKAELERDRNRNISDERELEQRPLRPDQMTPGARNAPRRASRDDGYQASPYGFGNPLPPDKLGGNTGTSWFGKQFGNLFGSKQDEQTNFTKEPARNALTEPPPGYQTPSPNQPYGLSRSTTTKTSTPGTYLETHGTMEGR
jgi:hypothetical protein